MQSNEILNNSNKSLVFLENEGGIFIWRYYLKKVFPSLYIAYGLWRNQR